MRQSVRRVDQALRPLLGGLGVPLISTYPSLAAPGHPRQLGDESDAELAAAARAATLGAVDTVFVDIEQSAPPCRRTGGTVLAVRAEDIPGGGPAAAGLRYPLGA